MAIALTHLEAAASSANDPSIVDNIDPPSGADICVWVGCSDESGAQRMNDVVTVSGGGATWTKIFTHPWRYRRRGWLFHGSGFTGPAKITFTFDETSTPESHPSQWVWIVDQATGLDATTPYSGLDTDYEETGTRTSITVTVTDTPDTGDYTYSVIQLENNQTSLAASGFTALGESAAGTHGVRRTETGYSSSGATSAAWTWGGSSQGVCAGIITLNAAADTAAAATDSAAMMGACF